MTQDRDGAHIAEKPNGDYLEEAAEMDHEAGISKEGAEVTPITSAFADWGRAKCIKKFWRLYACGLSVYAGYANSVVGSIVANEGFIKQFATVRDPKTGQPALNANHVSLWSSMFFVTAIAIQLIAPHTADRFGRKFNMWGVTFFLTLSIIVAIISKNWTVLLVARLIAGCAGGMMGTSVMVYMSEIAMPQFRGALLGSFSLAFSLGQVFLAIRLKILEDTNPMHFKKHLLLGSPAWYASKGKHEEAKKSLRKLVGDVEGCDVEHEYAVMRYEIDQSIALSQSLGGDSDWKALMTPINLKRAIISTLPLTFQNVVGVPLMFGYTTYFFSMANVEDPFLGKIVINAILLVGMILSFYMVDKVGRRTLVLGGGFGMMVICFIVGGLGFMQPTSASGPVLIALCGIWAFLYANSLAPIGWISLVEVSSPKLRAKTTSLAVTVQYITGIIFNYTVPLMLSNQYAGWQQKIGLFFGGITFVYLIPCVLLYPETKGRTYQELDELFERRILAWKFAKTKTAHQAGIELRARDL
ncbi:Major facilitator-type transporter ecdC [Colletotrichum aenigma]|uniref:Major facilitator-type transporter ecdC n=1 Tax=Colletotrichum aenigma TaxID=1215731 RepID=UPI0018727D58|nr:Major facilitator-type transporter ecdC [Colletotrichum aenigma]KAF5521898.1 Major facilitator-type transporter ecdC [Colletotrichum aenigma]